jgi:hypothetical protein
MQVESATRKGSNIRKLAYAASLFTFFVFCMFAIRVLLRNQTMNSLGSALGGINVEGMDLGKAEERVYPVKVRISNPSSTKILVDGISANCSCMKVRTRPLEIEAGAKVEAELDWDLTGRAGAVSEDIAVYLRYDGKVHHLVASCHATVEPRQ